MKYLITFAILLFSFTGISQTPYQKGMQKALDLWSDNQPWEAVNMFERIANAEPNEWLPSYYASFISVVHSFGEKDEAKLKAQLDRAQNFMNDAKAISKDNAELIILDCLWHTVWVSYDGAVYGMKYSAKVSMMYEEAIKLAPNSPRVILNKAEWGIGGAKFFGQSTEPYCEEIQKAIDLFAEFKPAGEFYPTYGLDRAIKLLKDNCNK